MVILPSLLVVKIIWPGVGLISDKSLAVSRLPISMLPEPASITISPRVVRMVSVLSSNNTILSAPVA